MLGEKSQMEQATYYTYCMTQTEEARELKWGQEVAQGWEQALAAMGRSKLFGVRDIFKNWNVVMVSQRYKSL